MKNTTRYTGKAAVFVRGFMEHYYNGNTALFDCQAAGKQATLDAGDELSIPYISKLSRALVSDGIVERYKVGAKYFNRDGEHTAAFKEFLAEHEDWGLLTTGTVQDLRDRNGVLDEIEAHGAVRGGEGNLIPRSAFSTLMKMVNEGKLDIAFVKSGATMGVKYKKETHIIKVKPHEG